jgi:hypothetical protein
MGGVLVIKLVKPIKILCSWTPYQAGVGQLLLTQAKSNIRTAAAVVLGKADAIVRQEVCRLDSLDRVLDHIAKFLALLVGNDGSQILNLDQSTRRRAVSTCPSRSD